MPMLSVASVAVVFTALFRVASAVELLEEQLRNPSQFAERSDDVLTQVEDTLKAISGSDRVPKVLLTFVKNIKANAKKVEKQLVKEHFARRKYLNGKHHAMVTCGIKLSRAVGRIEGAKASSPKNIAKLAKGALCVCRKGEAKAVVEARGCADQLKCRANNVKIARAAEVTFMKGARKTECTRTSLNTRSEWVWLLKKQTTIKKLMLVTDLARKKYKNLNTGSGTITVKKSCKHLAADKVKWHSKCLKAQNRATANQCYYHGQKKAACATYAKCYRVTVKNWKAAQIVERRDMLHRMHAWVGAKKIACLADSIKSLHGKLDFSKTSMAHCKTKTCNKKCKKALDLSKSINRKPPARMSCTLPGKPCERGGWSPKCAASLGTHTPIYRVGPRKGSVCSVKTARLRLKARNTKCHKCVKKVTKR